METIFGIFMFLFVVGFVNYFCHPIGAWRISRRRKKEQRRRDAEVAQRLATHPAEKINAICRGIEPGFWVPAVGNGQIAEFVRFVLVHNLVDELTAHQQEADFPQVIADVCQAIQPGFWVPAVGNGQIGEFVKFANQHSLWEQFRGLLEDEERRRLSSAAAGATAYGPCQFCAGGRVEVPVLIEQTEGSILIDGSCSYCGEVAHGPTVIAKKFPVKY